VLPDGVTLGEGVASSSLLRITLNDTTRQAPSTFWNTYWPLLVMRTSSPSVPVPTASNRVMATTEYARSSSQSEAILRPNQSAKSYSVNSELLSSIRHSFSASSALELFLECVCVVGSLVFPGSLQAGFRPAQF